VDSSPEFERLLRTLPEVTSQNIGDLLRFREFVLAENEIQNLTRLSEPVDFFEGHVLDAVHLLRSNWLSGTVMDLGSGAGMPGILCALLDSRGLCNWVLVDSEFHKAEFLSRAVSFLELTNRVQVFAGRGEAYLRENSVDTVVCRAVGAVDKIYGWIRQCSTWNNLVLFKSKGWVDEWAGFQAGKWRNSLKVQAQIEYSVGMDERYRLILRLQRLGIRG